LCDAQTLFLLEKNKNEYEDQSLEYKMLLCDESKATASKQTNKQTKS